LIGGDFLATGGGLQVHFEGGAMLWFDLSWQSARRTDPALTSRPSNHSFIQLFELQYGPSPMASDRTRALILDAAERLYAARGFGDVTLRDIVAAAGVNLAAVNYHFGSKDELIAELFVTRGIATNRKRLTELKQAEQTGNGRADVRAILRALVGPTLRGCLGPDNEQSTAAHFMIRASIESVPPIRRIKNREIDHLRKFAAAMRRSLPECDEADLYWCLHFALAMAHQTIRDTERLTRLSEGKCDLDDVEALIDRIVDAAAMTLTARTRANQAPTRNEATNMAVRRAEKLKT
jgi:AcrR family transcriptional regulator